MHLRPPARADLGGRGGWVLNLGRLPPQPIAGGVSGAVRARSVMWRDAREGWNTPLSSPSDSRPSRRRGTRPRADVLRPLPAAHYMCTCLTNINTSCSHAHPIWGGGVSCRRPLAGDYNNDRHPDRISSVYPGAPRSSQAFSTSASLCGQVFQSLSRDGRVCVVCGGRDGMSFGVLNHP